MFFFSRIASTVYTATNTIILDLLFSGSMTAYYTTADKLVSTAKSGLSPISDSLYPYMAKNRDFGIVKKILLIFEPLIILGCIILFIWARPICIWFFGEEYANTAIALRALLPVVVVVLPSYIFGFPMLSAMGLSKYANYSVIFASVVHIINLCILYFTDSISIVSLGVATSVAEILILLFRVVVVLKNRNRLHENKEDVKAIASIY
jgi:PST family polysaccharide transporter